MHIRKMFDRPIDRDIKGVIKIGQDDNENIQQELEEYVVTDELHRHIGDFFAAYRKGIEQPTDKIGVWISGFFGSGKSHFLKILSYLVENREINEKRAIDYFEDKIHDPKILADMQKAGEITTDVVLFDIDAKSESDSMADKDSIVKVLNKVFNEMQGFCGSIPWIAEIERNMHRDGTYETFRTTFKDISGSSWEDSREDFYYEEDAIIEALTMVTQMSEETARNWFERAEQEYTISIDRFARRVKSYIDEQGDNHHVAFMIDEVGQFIGDNSNAMLNLQTIVHELGRQCKGKAWIAVTSQEDIDSVLAVKGNDFSKIQGRFDTKLSLSSAYVDEVIRKRILLKNEAGTETLEEVYRKKQFILQNILSFPDNQAEMKQFADQNDFINVYPFIPYQFNLLQKVFTGVRIHGASGKHLAEGERSLLSAFQESAVYYAERDEGMLVPFSTFYETIETFLDSSIRTVIIQAGKNEKLEDFDIRVLKLLFLIKYVKEMTASLENIATLMIDHIDADKIELKGRIEKSLSRLIGQTLIQKNGNAYVFLTNDEQDVNREIKNMHVESSEVILKIGEEIFDGIYKDKKFRYSAKHHFPFNAFIDDRPVRTGSNNIGIRMLTPYADASMDYSHSELKMMSLRENNVIFKLPADTSYLEEMEEILKIQAYLKLKSGNAVSQAIEDIKTRKSREVTERRGRITTYVTEALKNADIFVNSQQMDINKKAAVERINDAFRTLIKTLYHKLDYVTEFIDTPKELKSIVDESIQLSTDTDGEPNHLAIKEVDNYVSRLTSRNQPMTVKSVTSYFAEEPYGWLELDTTSFLLQLFKIQEIKLRMSHMELDLNDNRLIDFVTKRDYVDRVVIKKRERVSPVLLKNAKDLSKELFGISALPTDEDGLKQAFNDELDLEKDVLTNLLANYRHTNYPGETILVEGKKMIQSILEVQDTTTWFKKLHEERHDLQAYAEDVKDVKDFFENQQDKYDRALDKLTIFKDNQTYVTDNHLNELVEKMDSIVNHISPYDRIQELPALYHAFDDAFLELLERECQPVYQLIETDLQTVMDELSKESEIKQKLGPSFRGRFESLKERLQRTNNLYEAVAMQVESDRLKVRCLNELEQEKEHQLDTGEQGAGSPPTGGDTQTTEKTQSTPVRQRQTKTLSKNVVIKGTQTLKTADDVDEFVEGLRTTLMDELGEDTTIHLV